MTSPIRMLPRRIPERQPAHGLLTEVLGFERAIGAAGSRQLQASPVRTEPDSTLVGRGGLEPPTSAVTEPQRCA
jgi:hypothetical protein